MDCWKTLICCVALQTAPLNVYSYTPRGSVFCVPCIWTFLNSPKTWDFSTTPQLRCFTNRVNLILTFKVELNRNSPSTSHTIGESSSGGTRSSQSFCHVRILVPQPMWSHRLVVRTLASHAGNRGSTPRGTTNMKSDIYKYININEHCGIPFLMAIGLFLLTISPESEYNYRLLSHRPIDRRN